MYPCAPRLIRRRVILGITAFTLCSAFFDRGSAADGPDADALKTQADRWIDLEKRAADERNEWRAQKEVLLASVEVLKAERSALQGKIEANDVAAKLFSARLNNAQSEFAAQEGAETSLTAKCEALEKRLRALEVRLPDPLKEKVRIILEKLNKPADGRPLAVPDRTHALVSALTAIDLFNNTLTLAHHLRQVGANETVDVKVLYWGLAVGYGIDTRGSRAWILVPGPQGWEWRDAPERLADIRALIAVNEKDHPRLVTLPVSAERGTP